MRTSPLTMVLGTSIVLASAACGRQPQTVKNEAIIGCVAQSSDDAGAYLVSFAEERCGREAGVRGKASSRAALTKSVDIAAATLNCVRSNSCKPAIVREIAASLQPGRMSLFMDTPDGVYFVFNGQAGELVELYVDSNGRVSTGLSFPETALHD